VLILDRANVEELLDVDTLIDALSVAMSDLSAGRVSMPKRTFAMVEDRGLLAAMPAYVGTSRLLAAKLVLVFPGNAAKGIETHQAVVAVFDPDTGEPAALMDGASITAIRTAAGSALATRLCARDDAKVLTIIGTGVQARSHADAVGRVRAFERVIVAGRTREHVEGFAAEIGAEVAPSIADGVSAADVVCTCTHATEPVVRREWVRPGTHVNAVGFTTGPELDPELFGAGLAVVELRDAAIGPHPNGGADISMAVDSGVVDRDAVVEVGEIVGGARPGRTSEDEITVYRSVGVAVQDATAAGIVLDAARKRGVGTDVPL
jgi:ornithine cyclodeaminase